MRDPRYLTSRHTANCQNTDREHPDALTNASSITCSLVQNVLLSEHGCVYVDVIFGIGSSIPFGIDSQLTSAYETE